MSELDDYKKKQRELIETHKHKNELPEKVVYDSDPSEHIVPKTFKEKWDNYWYHYKWRTFGIIIAVIFLISMIYPIIFPKRYDTSFSIVTEISFTDPQNLFGPTLTRLLDDYDNNGKLSLELVNYQLSATDDSNNLSPQHIMANAAKFSVNIGTGTYYLFMMDEAGYNQLTEQDFEFKNLTSLSDSKNIKDDKYYLTDTQLAKDLNLETDSSKLFLTFLDINNYSEKIQQKKSVQKAYERQWEYFKKLIAVE